MTVENTKLKRIEEKLDFLISVNGWMNDYLDYSTEKSKDKKELSKQEIEDKYNNQKFARLKRVEEKLDFFLTEEGLFPEYTKVRQDREENEKKKRRQLAMLQDKNEFLRKRAIQMYSNSKREIGEPVFIDNMWIYIDPEEKRIK